MAPNTAISGKAMVVKTVTASAAQATRRRPIESMNEPIIGASKSPGMLLIAMTTAPCADDPVTSSTSHGRAMKMMLPEITPAKLEAWVRTKARI